MTLSEPRLRLAWTFALFAALGAVHWAMVFGWPPRLPREAGDWPKEIRYYTVLQEAVTTGTVPYYVSRPIQETRKFLALPEILASPQVLLLRWLDVDAFVFANVLLLHMVGTAGCLFLQRRYALSAPLTVLVWLLMSFNGHITAHLAVGHSMWGGYFLVPWLLAFLVEIVERDVDARWPLIVGLLLAGMLLQGSFHVFVWSVLLLVLLLIATPRRRPILLALAWGAALGLVRLVPGAVVLLGRRDQSFQTGYASLLDLVAGLTVIRDADFPRRGGGSMGGLTWWEFDLYVGLAAAVWLVFAGVRGLLRGADSRRLGVPVLVLALLSLDGLYAPLHQVPLLASQRVSSRLLLLPVLVLVVLAARETETRLRESRGAALRVAAWLIAIATALSLAAHSWTWRLSRIEALSPDPPHTRDLEIRIAPRTGDEPKDAVYVGAVRGSAAASAAALALLAWRWRRRAVSR